MSVSINIIGIRNLDGKFKKMFALKQSCDEADVKYPKELIDYFNNAIKENGKNPDDYDDLKDIDDEDSLEELVTEIDLSEAMSGDGVMYGGETIDISKLSKEVKFIKIYAS